MEFIKVIPSDVSEEELIKVINNNVKISKTIQTEIEKLKSSTALYKDIETLTTIKNSPSPKKSSATPVTKSEEDAEIKKYYSEIRCLSPEEFESKISEIISSEELGQNKIVMYRLCAEIIKNIKELKDYIISGELTTEDIEEFTKEIEKENKKYEIIQKQIFMSQIESITEEVQQANNNIIFVPTASGNIKVLEEIEHMPSEYHHRFYGLFESIKNGTFKNDQRHRKPSSLAGINIVRDFNARVAYVRLDKNSYAIISAYIKKANNDKAIQNSLYTKYQYYKTIEEKLITNLENDEFMELNKQYETELFSMLQITEKSPVKDKGVKKNGTTN